MEPLPAALEAELRAIFAELDAEIAAHAPRCETSGRCCRFAEYGHTLFLCELEARLLLADGLPANLTVEDGLCPYQVGGLCAARDRRPTGCRVYFCDPAFAETMPIVAERTIARLKSLHDRLDLPWNYAPLQRFLDRSRPASSVSQTAPNPLVILDSSSCRP
jgi:hypothetical protein